MNDVWLCTYKTHQRLVVRCLTILTWHEVRDYAARKLGVDPGELLARLAEPADGELPQAVQVRYIGSDYTGPAGREGRRRLQEEVGGKWVDA